MGFCGIGLMGESCVESICGVEEDEVINGVVVDGCGEGIIGGNVIVEGRCMGRIRDLDGDFCLWVRKGKKIKICFIG